MGDFCVGFFGFFYRCTVGPSPGSRAAPPCTLGVHLVDRPVTKATIRNAAFESALTPWRARLKVALLTERRPSGRGGQPIGTLKLRRARVSRLRRH